MSYSMIRRRNRLGIHMVLRRLTRVLDSTLAEQQVPLEDLSRDSVKDSGEVAALVQPSISRTCLVLLRVRHDEAVVVGNQLIKRRCW
jgi:hypothetical protein